MKPLLCTAFVTTTTLLFIHGTTAHLPQCKDTEWYLPANKSCVQSNVPGARPFCKNISLSLEEITCFPFTESFMTCRRWAFTQKEFTLDEDGLVLKIFSEKRKYSAGDFNLRDGDDGLEAIVCINEESLTAENATFQPVYLYSAAWFISIISLAIAFVLCIAVPGLSTYRIVLPCYVGSLFVTYSVMLLRAVGEPPSKALCYSYGVILQFSFLSAFFWLNVIAFDIWRNVSKPSAAPSRKKFFAYLSYGWGCPLLLVGIAVAFDQSEKLGFKSAFKPQFEQSCWFNSTKARLAFFYGPIAAVLALNMIFFVLTLVVLRSTLHQTKGCKKSTSLWQLSVELAVVMGLCWIMEVISWAVGGDLRYWYFTDVINGLQGLFILIIIVRKPAVIKWMSKKILKKDEPDVDRASTVSYITAEDMKKDKFANP